MQKEPNGLIKTIVTAVIAGSIAWLFWQVFVNTGRISVLEAEEKMNHDEHQRIEEQLKEHDSHKR